MFTGGLRVGSEDRNSISRRVRSKSERARKTAPNPGRISQSRYYNATVPKRCMIASRGDERGEGITDTMKMPGPNRTGDQETGTNASEIKRVLSTSFHRSYLRLLSVQLCSTRMTSPSTPLDDCTVSHVFRPKLVTVSTCAFRNSSRNAFAEYYLHVCMYAGDL